jgi:hypothetical protein
LVCTGSIFKEKSVHHTPRCQKYSREEIKKIDFPGLLIGRHLLLVISYKDLDILGNKRVKKYTKQKISNLAPTPKQWTKANHHL